MSSKVRCRIILILLMCGLFASPVLAQGLVSGTVTGLAVDPNGAVIPDATITIANSAIGYARSTSSAGDGSFRFVAVPVNRYQLSATRPGFAVTRAEIAVKTGGTSLRTTLMPQQSSSTTLSGTDTLGDT